MGTVVEPYLFVGFHFFLSSKNALFQGNEVEMSTLHFHFCDFRGDIALQIPCDLEVAVDRFSDGKLSVVEDCVDPFVDGDVHRFDWPFDPEEVTFRLREGNGDADGEPYAVDHVAEEHIVARVNQRILRVIPYIHRAQSKDDRDKSTDQCPLPFDVGLERYDKGDEEAGQHPWGPVDKEGIVLDHQDDRHDASDEERQVSADSGNDRFGDQEQ